MLVEGYIVKETSESYMKNYPCPQAPSSTLGYTVGYFTQWSAQLLSL